MNDLISRQAAIDALDQIFDRCEEIEVHLAKGDPDRVGYKMYPDWLTVWKYLHQLPSAQQWIPCSERLPEEGVQVLVTDDAGGLATIDVDCGYFDEEFGRFEWFHSQNVTAWMPLPEPWKGEEGCEK